jgi:hypothetical protein
MTKWTFLSLLIIALISQTVPYAEANNNNWLQRNDSWLEQNDTAKMVEEAAEEARSQFEQAEVRHNNQIFLGVVILIITGFLWGVVRQANKGDVMKYHEKFGIIVVLVCGLLILFSLMISEHWIERYDFIQNLMTALQIRLFPEGCNSYTCPFTIDPIDFPTKYAVLSLLILATYGFTTYLGITPALKKKIKTTSQTTPDYDHIG